MERQECLDLEFSMLIPGSIFNTVEKMKSMEDCFRIFNGIVCGDAVTCRVYVSMDR